MSDIQTAGAPPVQATMYLRAEGITKVYSDGTVSLKAADLELADCEVVELHEAFAAQGLAVTRQLGLPDDADHVNPNGGAIALGHPLGATGAKLMTTLLHELERIRDRNKQLMLLILFVIPLLAVLMARGYGYRG